AGGATGLGYGYSDRTAAGLIADKLAPLVEGQDAMATRTCWDRMVACVRNLGRPGLCAQAISAVDVALWDLKCRLLGISLADLLGPHGRLRAQPGPAGAMRASHLRRGRRAMGPEMPVAGHFPGGPAGTGARLHSGLRQRRLHQRHPGAVARAGARLGPGRPAR